MEHLTSGDFQIADRVKRQLGYIRQSADAGSVSAQTELGVFYMSQFLCTADQEALSWFNRAAMGGSPEAMIRLSILYNNARGVVTRDSAKAKYWACQAAKLRVPDGIFLHAMRQTYPLYNVLGELSHTLSQNIQFFDLGHSEIGDAGVSLIAAILPASKIHSLYLKANKISDHGVKELAAILSKTRVQILDLWNNEVTDEGLNMLSNVLPQTAIQVLDLAENRITSLENLGEVLPFCHALRILHLGKNLIIGENISAFAAGLRESNVHLLDIGYNLLNSLGGAEIVAAAPDSMRVLDLSNNELKNAGATAIAKLIPHKKNLRLLDLKKNGIETDGGQCLLDALAETGLEVINLRQNQINTLALSDNLYTVFPRSVLNFNLQGNPIQKNVLARITRFITRRKNKSFPAQKRDISLIVPEGRVTDEELMGKIHAVIDNRLDVDISINRISYQTIKQQIYVQGTAESEVLKILHRRNISPKTENVVVSISFRSAEKSLSKNDLLPYLFKINFEFECITDAFTQQDTPKTISNINSIANNMAFFSVGSKKNLNSNNCAEVETGLTGNDFNQLASNHIFRSDSGSYLG